MKSFTAVFITVNAPLCSFLHDNQSSNAQRSCASHTWCLLCVKLLVRPHTEKLHLSSPLPLSHQLQKWVKQSLHNNSASPSLAVMKSFFFFKWKMLSCCFEDAQLTQDKQNWHAENRPNAGCSFISFDHKSRLMDFAAVCWSRKSFAVLALLPRELSRRI